MFFSILAQLHTNMRSRMCKIYRPIAAFPGIGDAAFPVTGDFQFDADLLKTQFTESC